MANRPQPATEKAASWVIRKRGTAAEAAEKFGLHLATVYRALIRAKAKK